MIRRKISFTAPCVAEIISEEILPPKENEVQVKLAISTISSGTERSNLIGDPNISAHNRGSVVFPKTLGWSS